MDNSEEDNEKLFLKSAFSEHYPDYVAHQSTTKSNFCGLYPDDPNCQTQNSGANIHLSPLRIYTPSDMISIKNYSPTDNSASLGMDFQDIVELMNDPVITGNMLKLLYLLWFIFCLVLHRNSKTSSRVRATEEYPKHMTGVQASIIDSMRGLFPAKKSHPKTKSPSKSTHHKKTHRIAQRKRNPESQPPQGDSGEYNSGGEDELTQNFPTSKSRLNETERSQKEKSQKKQPQKRELEKGQSDNEKERIKPASSSISNVSSKKSVPKESPNNSEKKTTSYKSRHPTTKKYRPEVELGSDSDCPSSEYESGDESEAPDDSPSSKQLTEFVANALAQNPNVNFNFISYGAGPASSHVSRPDFAPHGGAHVDVLQGFFRIFEISVLSTLVMFVILILTYTDLEKYLEMFFENFTRISELLMPNNHAPRNWVVAATNSLLQPFVSILLLVAFLVVAGFFRINLISILLLIFLAVVRSYFRLLPEYLLYLAIQCLFIGMTFFVDPTVLARSAAIVLNILTIFTSTFVALVIFHDHPEIRM